MYAVKIETIEQTTYVGEAKPGTSAAAPSWRIKRIVDNGGMTITWADGDNRFDNIWNNRISLNYL